MVGPEPDGVLGVLLRRASELEAWLRNAPAEVDSGASPEDAQGGRDAVAARLKGSVIRPLEQALRRLGGADGAPADAADRAPTDAAGRGPAGAGEDESSLDRRLHELAVQATSARVLPSVPAELVEATAALQDLACRSASGVGEDAERARRDELEEIQRHLPCEIQAQTDGPYLVTNLDNVSDWLGQELPSRPQLALCRCGASAIKPLCDGTHARDRLQRRTRTPSALPDRRDTYVGQQVTILDNRGICQHSGFCTDRLASVFRAGTEPFVAPSGGRMDEIIRAVRDCPSGALSYAIDGRRGARCGRPSRHARAGCRGLQGRSRIGSPAGSR